MSRAPLIGVAAAAIALLPAAPAASQGSPQGAINAYFGNTLSCRLQGGPDSCHVWFNPDGRYVVVYDYGPQQFAPVIGSQFRGEGRTGSFTVRSGQVCLTPDPVPGKRFGMQTRGLLYGASGCYPLAAAQAGSNWQSTDSAGRTFTYWLVRGR